MKEIGFEEFASMLTCACKNVCDHHEELSQLDSHGGDGDHGSTMRRAMDQVNGAVAATAGKGLSGLLEAVGWAIMGVDGGATGPLFGSLFLGMAPVAAVRPIDDGHAVASLFRAALEGVQRRTKAQPGDKTLIDALVPAVTAMELAADSGASIEGVISAGARGAREGAEATRHMQARFGRARNIGERSIGEPDPGATSMAYLLEGFEKGARTDA